MPELGTLKYLLSWGWECSTITDLTRDSTQASWLVSSLQISYKRLLAVLGLSCLSWFWVWVFFCLVRWVFLNATVLWLKFYGLLESCIQNAFYAVLWHFWTKRESIEWLKCESLFRGLCYCCCHKGHIVMK